MSIVCAKIILAYLSVALKKNNVKDGCSDVS